MTELTHGSFCIKFNTLKLGDTAGHQLRRKNLPTSSLLDILLPFGARQQNPRLNALPDPAWVQCPWERKTVRKARRPRRKGLAASDIPDLHSRSYWKRYNCGRLSQRKCELDIAPEQSKPDWKGKGTSLHREKLGWGMSTLSPSVFLKP